MTDPDFIECPYPLCDGGMITTGQNWTAGTDTDEPCSLCQGDGGFDTHDEADEAWERIGCCSICRDPLEDCRCLVHLPARLTLVADRPSARERREHARVLTFPHKKAAPGSHPDAA